MDHVEVGSGGLCKRSIAQLQGTHDFPSMHACHVQSLHPMVTKLDALDAFSTQQPVHCMAKRASPTKNVCVQSSMFKRVLPGILGLMIMVLGYR